MAEKLELTLGEEKSVHLPPLAAGEWEYGVEGMASAVEVRKLWAADPYPEDDEDEEKPRPTPDVVFMIRGMAPGSARVRFSPRGEGRTAADAREVEVSVHGR
ncbi:MAG TPA: hypothetical protein VHI54_11425 [Actinomycetota bacterium]|nr:hypothetical protein [Actinomycetota bacterium]